MTQGCPNLSIDYSYREIILVAKNPQVHKMGIRPYHYQKDKKHIGYSQNNTRCSWYSPCPMLS